MWVYAAAVNEHNEGDRFRFATDEEFSPSSRASIQRFRATVQGMNASFAEGMHPYVIDKSKCSKKDKNKSIWMPRYHQPRMNHKSLPGIGERSPLQISTHLLWGKCFGNNRKGGHSWHPILEHLMDDLCPKDIAPRPRTFHFEENLKMRHESALKELVRMVEDHRGHPINYNYYYTDMVKKCCLEQEPDLLSTAFDDALKRINIQEPYS
ncbi:hypothetical protein DM02DRAFT_631155 [Periconia macrospinosa]|uniref:Uncharacterized protein n=1 Tax=Periconia macrospinosa TaxID=97972 RepID=A0A2V1DH62_9PLEO|nr:hypothetical protein DM02DRAFT_631155 [Periconia macrospinosa]